MTPSPGQSLLQYRLAQKIGEGCAVGAVVSRSLEPWGIRGRSRDLLEAETRLRAAMARGDIVLPVSRL